MTPTIDGPRSHRDKGELVRKFRLLHEPHVVALTAHADEIKRQRGAHRVPYFDPTEAGVGASTLLLLEAPGPKATSERGGSGFVSTDNDDGTASNLWSALREAGVDRARDVVTWNVVPWYIGSDRRIRPADSDDLIEGQPHVSELLSLLPNLGVVVLIGKPAARGWARLGFDLPTVEAPHPSPQNLNTRPQLRAALVDALRAARALAIEYS